MTKPTRKRPRDFSQAAKMVVDIATGQVEDRRPTALIDRGTKNEHRATILLPNRVAEHDTKRDLMDGPAKILKENRTVQNGSSPVETVVTEFRVRCSDPFRWTLQTPARGPCHSDSPDAVGCFLVGKFGATSVARDGNDWFVRAPDHRGLVPVVLRYGVCLAEPDNWQNVKVSYKVADPRLTRQCQLHKLTLWKV